MSTSENEIVGRPGGDRSAGAATRAPQPPRPVRAAALAAVLLLSACTDPDSAQRTLLDAGYTNVNVGGYDMWGCGRDDTYATRFTASGPTGRPVSGVVCKGVFKSSTVRLD